jgi:acetate kinase
MLAERVIICHLGGGASVAAVHKGKIIDSSMGFSPLEGVLMATRSGTIDISAYEHIKSVGDFDTRKAFEYLNSKSGLLGVSGTSSDIRELLKTEAQDSQSKLALDMYVYKIQQAIGAMAAVMGGTDSLAFTGTVGERSSEIRRRITATLLYLGFALYDNEVDSSESVRLLSKPTPLLRCGWFSLTKKMKSRVRFSKQLDVVG